MVTILHYFKKMVLPAIFGSLLWLGTYPIRMKKRRRKQIKSGKYHECVLCILFMYLSILLWLTLTPPDFEYYMQTGQWLYSHGFPFQGEINLIPGIESWRLFCFYLEKNMWSAILINFPGNILMFVPVGLLTALLSDKPQWWKGTIWAFLLSLFIETAQLFVARGTDVDDLILNTLGGLLGYMLFLLFRHTDPFFTAQCARHQKGGV